MNAVGVTIGLTLLGAYVLTNFVACLALCWITKEHTDTIERVSGRVTDLELRVTDLEKQFQEAVKELAMWVAEVDNDC